MNEILNTAVTVLVLLAGLAALIRYVRNDVFAGPFAGPGNEFDATDARDAERSLSLP